MYINCCTDQGCSDYIKELIMFEDNALTEKINRLFSETHENDDAIKEQLFPSGKMELEDMSEEEQEEVRDYLQKLEDRLPPKIKRKWHWKLGGRLIVKALLFCLEFVVLSATFYFLLPIAINITGMTITKALVMAAFCNIIKAWWK